MAHPHFKGNLKEAVSEHLNGLGNLDFAVAWEMASHETVKHMQFSGLNSISVPLSLKNVKRVFSFQCQEVEEYKYKVEGQAKQIPADKVIQDEFDKVRPFFKETVQELAEKALAMLGLNQAAVTVEAELHSVLIQGPGGVLSTDWKAPENPKTFCIMLIQVPVEGGHEGGGIIVKHSNKVKQFDSWQSSSELCHITAFYSDCAHKLENVTFGWRLALVFHLNLTSSALPGSLSPIPSLPIFVSINNVRDVLKQWSNQIPPLLALPLEHRYTNSPRFAFLKGRDRALAQLLLSVDSEIDLHLVQLVKEEEGAIDEESSEEDTIIDQSQLNMKEKFKSWCDCCVKKRCNCFRHLLDCIKIDDGVEEFDVNCWIDVNDQVVQMVPKLDVSLEYNLLYGCKKSVFLPEMVPDKKDVTISNAMAEGEDETMSESESESFQILLQFYYHRNVFVIWPKKRSLYFTLMHNFPAILDRLDEPGMLTRAINHCQEHPSSTWKRNDKGGTALRLVTKCVETEGVSIELKLKLLKILAIDFKTHNNHSLLNWDNVYFEGIKSGQVASAVARLISQLPWLQACHAACNLFSSMRARKQLDSLAQLVTFLKELNCLDAVRDLSNEINNILSRADWNENQPFEPSALVTCVGMYFKLLECTNFNRFQSKILAMCDIKLPTLFLVIQGIEERYSEVLGRSEACRCLINDLRFAMAGRKIPMHSGDLAVQVFLYLYRLGNLGLLTRFYDNVINNDQDEALDLIVSSAEIWNECLVGAAGNSTFRSMVEQRIYQMECYPQPVFSWIQNCPPKDVDIIVQQFIRSPLKFKTFFFSDKSQEDVQSWIDEQFGRPEEMILRGFSVVTVLKQIEDQYSVTVTKTPEVFRICMEKFLDVRRSLLALRDRYQRRLMPLQNVFTGLGKKLQPIKRPLIQ